MKILAIRIKNLASLEGITEIDFTQEPLSSAGIFAITGPTGSGKSTILDALCLALYCKTPRYIQAKEIGIEVHDVQGSTISQGDARGILRDGTGDGYAEVDFVGIDHQDYRARWSVRRARNKAEGSIQADTIELTNLSSNVIIPGRKTETLKEIESLVGLSFEQFTRSVLLAQGDFTAFLKANKDDKSSLLEKLTGTHIYSQISKQVYENHKKEEQELRDLQLRSQAFAVLSDDELTSLNNEKEILENEINTQTKGIEDLNKEINWHTRLSELKSEKEEAHLIYHKALEDKNNAAARKVTLEQIDRVQKTRNWIDAHQSAEQSIAERTLALKELEDTLFLYKQQGKELESIVELANINLNIAITDQKKAIPLLDKAKELDILIKQKLDQKALIQKELDTAQKNYDAHSTELKSKQQKADQLLVDIEKLQAWKDENTFRQPIAKNRDLIISKLSDAQKLVDSHLLSTKEAEENQKRLQEAKAVKSELALQLSTLANEKATSQHFYEILQNEIASIKIESLDQEKAELSQSIENTFAANAQWKLLFAARNDFDSFSKKLSANKAEYKTKETSLKQATIDLEKAQIQKDVSNDMLKKARLAAAENVESLRSQLIPEEPCPVCGSESHPYTLHEPRLNKVMAQIEGEHKQIEQAHAKLLRTHASLQEALTNLEQTIQSQEADLIFKQNTLVKVNQTWSSLSLPIDHDKIPDIQKAGWLEGVLTNLKTRQSSLQGEIDSYTHKKKNLERQKATLEEIDRKSNHINNGIKDIDRTLVSHQEAITRILKEQGKTDQLLAEVEGILSPYFSHGDWMNNWKNNPIPFLQRIDSFADQWKSKTEKLDQDTQNHSILKATITALEGQSKSLSGEIEKYEKEYSAMENSYSQLAQERMLIFDGENTHVVEEKMNQAIETAQEIVNTHKKKQEELHTINTRLLLQKEQISHEINELKSSLAGYSEQIQQWLSAYNKQYATPLSNEQLISLLSYSHEWIDAERTVLRAIDDSLTQALSVFNERKVQLERHEEKRLSEQSFENLKILIESAHSTLETITNSRNEINFKLQVDRDNRKQIANLLKTIQSKSAVAENWSRLNEIIGSADGKKFRQIAQEYTLDVLLSYANVHLEMLTKRYRIQRIPNTLGLQVLDQDMGDEIRTVYSLSGGESFLVSLALALGLASLSSSKMKVESLFIDEGFGSLDPTTLNIAMDALERLHNKGRKVGVISHVQEMTERIPAQIKVSKQANGKSRVEVLG